MKLKLIAAMVAATMTSSVVADDISYDNLTVGYTQSSLDAGSDIDLDGFGAGLSFSVADDWYLKLDTSMQSGDEAGVDFDLDLSTLNFGYHTAVSGNTDFIAELGYARVDVEASAGGFTASDDDSAANVVLGFRGKPTTSFEWGASVQHMDFDDSATFLNLEGRYFFTDNFSLGLEGKFESDLNIYALEARFDF